MIEWHKVKDELPEERKTVLLAYWDVNGCYSEKNNGGVS